MSVYHPCLISPLLCGSYSFVVNIVSSINVTLILNMAQPL